MNDIISSVNNSKGGFMSLNAEGDMIIGGSYYVIHDNDLVPGAQRAYIPKRDIMRIGDRRYSSRKKLIATGVTFGISLLTYGVIGTVKSGVSPIKSVTDKAGEAAGFISDYDSSGISGMVRSASGAFGSLLDNLYSIITIAAIITFIISVYWLVQYVLSHKNLIEINTSYGFYCIDRAGVNNAELDRLISEFYRLRSQPAQPQYSQARSASWYCPACGTPNSGKFCIKCGTKKV